MPGRGARLPRMDCGLGLLSLPQGLVYVVAVLNQLCSSVGSTMLQTRPTPVSGISPTGARQQARKQEAKQNPAPVAGSVLSPVGRKRQSRALAPPEGRGWGGGAGGLTMDATWLGEAPVQGHQAC